MSILVTGGAGFIGSHLVERLLQEGNNVVVVDCLWTGSADNIKKFQDNDKFKFINCDVRNCISIPEDMFGKILYIYHLACPASPDHFERSPVEILETCFQGTKNVLDLALKSKAKVLIASTSEIYGDPEVSPQSEKYWGNTNSFGPRSCYDEGKRITEALAYGYQKSHGLEIRIARIFNVYGPSMQIDDGRAVPNFIAAAKEGRPLLIYGDGSSTRSFQYVSDCVSGLIALMKSNYRQPVNIGNDIETRVDDIAKLIVELVQAKLGDESAAPDFKYLTAREDDPRRRKPDITLANEVLHWKPTVTLRDGLMATMDYFM